MPTYEYLCESCKKGFEMLLTITERAKAHVKCPGCGSKKVNPQLTVFSPVLAESGTWSEPCAVVSVVRGARASPKLRSARRLTAA